MKPATRAPRKRARAPRPAPRPRPRPRRDLLLERVRILFLAANPSDQTRLALTREVEAFSDRLRATDHRDAYEIIQHWDVEPGKLQGLILRHKPQILHFSGHGTKAGQLAFQDVAGASATIPIDVVAKTFEVLHKYVRCVVLNACFSRDQAAAIVQNVEVVVGMSDAVDDRDAIEFTGSFYETLGYGEDVNTAFQLACNAIGIARGVHGVSNRQHRLRDVTGQPHQSAERTGAPQLLTRRDVDPSRVRFVPSE